MEGGMGIGSYVNLVEHEDWLLERGSGVEGSHRPRRELGAFDWPCPVIPAAMSER